MKKFIFLLFVGFGTFTQAQVLGFVEGTPECKAPTEVFVAQGKNLLFQIHVPVNGTFEVKLNPGKYDLVAVNEEGCEGRQTVDFKKEQINTQVKIAKVEDSSHKRKPTMATDVARMGPVNMGGQFGAGFGFYSYPWWNPWAFYSYPMSYGYPCMWVVWGCNTYRYPAGGPIAMGKPNIYVEGPDIRDAKIELDIVDHHLLMATAPAHMEKGWTFSLEKNKLKVQGTQYPYLFYDSRAQLKKIPNTTSGFCGTREGILEQMHSTLEKMKFPKAALKDFAEYWVVKLPKLKNFCVYPQINEQMNEAAPLKVSMNSYDLTRALFFVIPKPGRRDLPKEAFLKELVQRTPAQWVDPVVKPTTAKWKIYEWGIAFPFEKGAK